jgi:hypothetical protein
MSKQLILVGVLMTVALSAFAKIQSDRVFEERFRIAVIEPSNGDFVDQIAVKLPVSAKIPKVEVFADVKDMGRSKSDWKTCNIETKVCAVGDVRIVRFHRVEHRETDEPWQELSVDMMNENPTETRAVKLFVTYQPQSGAYLESCLDDPNCGWHKRLPASE